jgi:GalNAc5-diNAcBac-PP-undecaprenol beta-1,3-glucosyltransferase
MNNHPFFSVVIPTYNRIDKLLITLSTISAQRFNDFEIIIVNDGSTDNTLALLEKYKEKDSRLRIVNQENKERGAARNNGFRNATGNYVVFFDSDDLMHTNHLETLYKYIHELNFPFFIATKFDFVNAQGEHFDADIKNIKQGYYDYHLFLNGNVLACNICVNKSNPKLFFFEEDRSYSIKEDWLFLIQNLFKENLFIIDRVTVTMSDHPERSMRSDNKLIVEKTFRAQQWILEKVQLNSKEQKTLLAHVNYFCGIHSYLDGDRKKGIQYSLKAIQNGGLKRKYVLLLLKSFAGNKIIARLK